MRFLLDTHVLLWAAAEPDRLSVPARKIIETGENELLFSSASIWEIAIKSGLGRSDFLVDSLAFHRALIHAGYVELAIQGEHAADAAELPPHHKDPFDRLLVAQARAEGLTLVTSDAAVARYPGMIRRV